MSPYNRQNDTLDLIRAGKLRSQRVANNKLEVAPDSICHSFDKVFAFCVYTYTPNFQKNKFY